MAIHPVTFGDAADAENLVGKFGHVALYGPDTDFPTPHDVAAHWPDDRKHWITFGGLRSCQLADFEPGTEVYADPTRLRTWAQVRHDRQQRAIVYADLSNVQAALDALDGLPADFWIAWWTGTPKTPEEIRLALAQIGVSLAADRVWAQQYATKVDEYDTSRLFGSW